MSLAIDIDNVIAVLLAGKWHNVIEKSFVIDSYEFVRGDQVELGGGTCALVASTGFAFKTTKDEWIAGPLTAILAVRYR